MRNWFKLVHAIGDQGAYDFEYECDIEYENDNSGLQASYHQITYPSRPMSSVLSLPKTNIKIRALETSLV